MCSENFWTDIVESRDSHTYPDTEKDRIHDIVSRRKLGLPDDAPRWLEWAVISYPPGHINRQYRRTARNAQRKEWQRQINSGVDWEDIIIETRASRLDGRAWWW